MLFPRSNIYRKNVKLIEFHLRVYSDFDVREIFANTSELCVCNMSKLRENIQRLEAQHSTTMCSHSPCIESNDLVEIALEHSLIVLEKYLQVRGALTEFFMHANITDY